MHPASGVGTIVRVLRQPNFGHYTAGSMIALVGFWMQRVATGWLTWQLHHLNDPATTPELPAGIVTIAPNFDMLPGGGAARNATEILDHFVGASLLDRLYAQYDLAMLDTPPVAVFPDALLLCRTRAELIYICRFETVRLGMARKSLARIHDTDMSVLGVVLNQIPSKRVKAYGYEGYGSYDSHYYKAYSSPTAVK